LISKQKFQKEIGKRIREVREKKGISLKEFESRDNALDRSELSKIENGQKSPTLYTLYKIAFVLDVDLVEFFRR
jgi:transcriptional regulator with XRE-family HTH domain